MCVDTSNLPLSYELEAAFIENVQPDEAVFLPDDPAADRPLKGEDSTESSMASYDAVQTSSAFAKAGLGWVGYVGDKEDTAVLRELIMGMCRIPKT